MGQALKCIRRIGLWRWLSRSAVRQLYGRVLRQPILVRLPTGMAYLVRPGDNAGAALFVTGAEPDRGAGALLHRLTAPNGLFLDVGRGAGYYALYMYPKCAAVHAFGGNEADNAHLSAYGLPRLVVHPGAVPATGLDDLMRGRRQAVTGIKVDGVGLLRGAHSLLVEDRPIALVGDDGAGLGDLYGLAEETGYVVGGFPSGPDAADARPFRFIGRAEAPGLEMRMWLLVPRERAPELERREGGGGVGS